MVNACFCEARNINVDRNVKVTEMLFIAKSNPCNRPYSGSSTVKTCFKTKGHT